MKVLVVDDSRAMRLIIGSILADFGFEVVEAPNGAEAMKYFEGPRQVDLLLVDWNMPLTNGYELVCAVRSKPSNKDICIIMVTSEADQSRIDQAKTAGANEYIIKPFTKEIMQEKLTSLGLIKS